ncbi:hypothetical protein, partial [Streptomyces rochei]|uniref:hypothetical protein n=1 Tax=Streptomyces rochei TaxID=1928 RepID=UPI0022E9E22A
MKKGYSFIHTLAHVFSRVLPLIIIIAVVVSVQSFALNFVRESDFFTWPVKVNSDSKISDLQLLENSKSGLSARIGNNLKSFWNSIKAPVFTSASYS